MRLIEADVKSLCHTCLRSSGLSNRYRGSNTILCSSFSQVENADTCSRYAGWMMLTQNKRMSITHFITNCSICKIFMAHWIFTFGWTVGLTFIYFQGFNYLQGWSFIIVPELLNFSPLFPEACLWNGWSAAPVVMIHFFLHHTQRDGPVFKKLETKYNSFNAVNI